MIDKLFSIVLVLNATGLFRFIAPQLDVSIGQVSMALLGVNVIYLVSKAQYSKAILLQSGMGGWLFVLLIWPLSTLLYARSFEVRQVGLLLYYFSLFFGAVVYTASNGLPAIHRVIAVSLAVTIFGFVLSMLVPEYFQDVALLAQNRINYNNRAFGFFMQPNQAAIGFALLFFGWFSLWKHKNTMLEVVALVTFLGLMFLTGSRTGTVVAVIVIGLSLAYSWRRQPRTIRAFRRSYLKVLLLGACLLGGLFWTTRYLSSADYEKWGLLDRISMLTSFRLTDSSIREDVSVMRRLDAQAVYWAFIKVKPLFGHGFGAETHYYENGHIDRTSHSTLLTCWMEYGIFYPIALGLLMVRLYLTRRRARAEGALATDSVFQFVLIVLFLFTVSGNLLNARVFYVVWAMFFAAVYCPACTSICNKAILDADSSSSGKGNVSVHLARMKRMRRFRDEHAMPRSLT